MYGDRAGAAVMGGRALVPVGHVALAVSISLSVALLPFAVSHVVVWLRVALSIVDRAISIVWENSRAAV